MSHEAAEPGVDGPFATEDELLDGGTAPPPEVATQDDGENPTPDGDPSDHEEDTR